MDQIGNDNGIKHYLRLVGTCVAYCLFGLGTICLSFIVCPLINLSSSDESHKIRRVRLSIHYGSKYFLYLLDFFSLLHIEIENSKGLEEAQGSLVLANHPTIFDILLIFAISQTPSCIVKTAVKKSFFFRYLAKHAGYIFNEDPQELIDSSIDTLLKGNTLVVFPEGTRSPRGGINRFQRGAAEVVLRTGVPIIPVVFTCIPALLGKGTPWHYVPKRTPRLRCRVLPAISAQVVVPENCPSWVFRRKLSTFLQNFFEAELSNEQSRAP